MSRQDTHAGAAGKVPGGNPGVADAVEVVRLSLVTGRGSVAIVVRGPRPPVVASSPNLELASGGRGWPERRTKRRRGRSPERDSRKEAQEAQEGEKPGEG